MTGCAASPSKLTTLKDGTCKVVHTPPVAVKGATAYDQDWIDETTEALVGGCRQPRPKARPPELNAKPKPLVAPAPAPKKKTWRERVRIWPR